MHKSSLPISQYYSETYHLWILKKNTALTGAIVVRINKRISLANIPLNDFRESASF